ncbi:MAG: DUF6483 family protein [Butyrivibrio sp.]
MFEQDYIMRLVKEMIRMLLKLLFNIDTESPSTDLMENVEQRAFLNELLDMIDKGKINEAENLLFDPENTIKKDNLKTALLFYSYLNEKDDDFLEANNYSRDEIRSGIKEIAGECGMDGIAGMFLEEM